MGAMSVGNKELQELYADVIQEKRKYTNCYFTMEELRRQCSKDKVSAEMKKGSLLIWVREDGYKKLYFTGNDLNWTEGFPVHERESVVIEIVTKGDLGEYDFSKRMKCQEVIQYTRFRRGGFAEPDSLSEADIEFCVAEDIPVIRHMLYTNFSVIGDYIPTDDDLKDFVSNGKIICQRDGRNIKGYVIFEDKGKTSYIRNICVDKGYRGKGVGKQLMAAYFYMHRDFKGFTLWCKTTNTPALKLYKWGGTTVKPSIIISLYADTMIEQEAA